MTDTIRAVQVSQANGPLDDAPQAFSKMLGGATRFRGVLTPATSGGT